MPYNGAKSVILSTNAAQVVVPIKAAYAAYVAAQSEDI